MTTFAVCARWTVVAAALGILISGPNGARAQNAVNIGLLAPFSGPWAEHGKNMRDGAEMAVEDINAKGGIQALGGAKLNLIVADTGPSVETTTNAAQRLLSQEPYPHLCAAFSVRFRLAASEIGERQHVPMLTFSFSDQLVSRGYQYIFRDSSGANTQVRTVIKLLKDQAQTVGRSIKSAALIGDNTAASVAYFKSLNEALPQGDVSIVLKQGVDAAAHGCLPVALAARDANPDIIFINATTFDDSVAIIRGFNAAGVKKLMVGNGAQYITPQYFEAMGAEQLEGLTATQGTAITKDPFAADFLKRYQARTKIAWTTHDTTSLYSETWIIKDGLEKAASADPTKVRDAVSANEITTPPPTAFVGSAVKFDANGQNPLAPPFLLQWQNGIPVVVTPAEFAVAPLKWP